MNINDAESAPVILWRRVDQHGHESARVDHVGEGWRLTGTAVFADDAGPCCLSYRIECDAAWRTVRTRVTGWIGQRTVDVEIAVAADGVWRMNGVEVPQVAGCVDVDLNFSPSTNLLPIRRLNLAVGERADVRAAWLRFPSLALEPLQQTYIRTGERAYRYESAGGAFVRDLTVDEAGFPTRYPDFWEREGD
ncbi:MAG TPA: putative glycolipid-binding domain-containing protein [Longimicrobium sp.]|jgi:hypothetical protein|uniref:putative glycolipid-binding domain-containing protein n=1 Tax=Longimicrobium sp. TaxID=2029185 RepID=UPI002EDAF0C0